MAQRQDTVLPSDAAYQALFTHAPCGILVFDAETGELVDFNDAACASLGYTRAEFAELNVSDIDVEKHPGDAKKRMTEIVAAGYKEFSDRHWHRDGTIRDMYVSCKALEIEGKTYLQSTWRDVTEQKQIEAQRVDLMLRQIQFMQNVSHELRTPLALIMGYSDLLAQGLFGVMEEEQHEAIEIILRRARSLRRMVEDILAIIEIEQRPEGIMGDFKPVDVSMLVQQLVQDQQIIAAEQGISLTYKAVSRVVILGDAGLIQQSIDNVVQNALKFTRTGGLVDVEVYTDRERSSCVIKVQDTGVGIAKESLPAIFNRFYQVNGSDAREYGGLGLGLAVAKEIVETHGGRMDVESVLGKGTTFRLYYPLAEVNDG